MLPFLLDPSNGNLALFAEEIVPEIWQAMHRDDVELPEEDEEDDAEPETSYVPAYADEIRDIQTERRLKRLP